MFYVGSVASNYWGLTNRDTQDEDIWDYEFKPCDCDFSLVSEELYHLFPTVGSYATPDALYTLKVSHLGWDNPQWWKHVQDALLFKSKGCKLVPELYNALVEHWKVELHGKEFLSLDRTKEQFFNDFVTYTYDHDHLHDLVAYPDKPMYTKILKNDEEVLTCENKFKQLSFEDQVKTFREEIVVIACERWWLTDYWHERGMSWNKAYQLALKKTITNLTKGWATDFIVQNLDHFVIPQFGPFKNVITQLNLEEKYMSKVDMTPFEQILLDGLTEDTDLSNLIYGLCNGDLDFISWGGGYSNYKENVKTFKEKYGYAHLQQEGGGEGGSEYCFGVFALGGKVYRAEYSYYSYNGHEYDYIESTLKEVQPVQKTITVYE